jgi:hypothetical protein
MFAVLMQAERTEALAWLTNRDGFTAASCFSVNAVCDALGIDLPGLRQMVLRRSLALEAHWKRPAVGRLFTPYVGEMAPVLGGV